MRSTPLKGFPSFSLSILKGAFPPFLNIDYENKNMPPLPGYWNVKVKRIGKFSFKALFDGNTHQCYGDKSLYEEVEL